MPDLDGLGGHISPVVARELASKRPEIDVIAVQAWEDGAHIGLPDMDLLQLAATQGLSLVTYDQRTIAPLLNTWGEGGVAAANALAMDIYGLTAQERTLFGN